MSKLDGIKTETKIEYEDVPEADIFEFKQENDFIEGKLIHMEKDVGQHKSKLYHIKQTDNTIKKIWGSKILDDRLLAIDFGTQIKIIYEGKETPDKGQPYHKYKIQRQTNKREA